MQSYIGIKNHAIPKNECFSLGNIIMITLIALIYPIFKYCVSFRKQVILRPKFIINMKPKKRNKWKWLHKWAGLLVSVFMLLFCISGIILNHRDTFSQFNIDRSLLPSSYKLRNYNNGIIRGTLPLEKDSLLAFGSCGVWVTDSIFSNTYSFNNGLPTGIDRRNVRNIIKDKNGQIWCATTYDLYKLKRQEWIPVSLPKNHSKITDISLMPDNPGIIVLTRSNIYKVSPDNIKEITIQAPLGKNNEISLFKTIWNLHSGELWGLPGRIVVDLIAIVLIILCLTGIILFIMPFSIRNSSKVSTQVKILKWNFKWHNIIGYFTIVFTILLVFTGMCLRPPLMIPFVMTKTTPLSGSSLDTDNYWHDKFRAIRWDEDNQNWLISTSDGFVKLKDFSSNPVIIPSDKSPVVSPMGVNVFYREAPGVWIIGSFSGIYRWKPNEGRCYTFHDNTLVDPNRRNSFGLANDIVSGYSADTYKPIVFDYSKGTEELNPMGSDMRNQPMSLWNFALELHVGRCYSSFLGPISNLFVFLSGIIILLVLASGYIISCKIKKSHNINQ